MRKEAASRVARLNDEHTTSAEVKFCGTSTIFLRVTSFSRMLLFSSKLGRLSSIKKCVCCGGLAKANVYDLLITIKLLFQSIVAILNAKRDIPNPSLCYTSGGVLLEKLGRGVRPASQNPNTLFMTKISDFCYPSYDLTKNLIPYL